MTSVFRVDFTNFVSQIYIFVILKVKRLTMVKVTKEAALEYHNNGRPGKIEVTPTNLIVHRQTLVWHIRLAWHTHA